jgi:CheY-like chemotaxis protein
MISNILIVDDSAGRQQMYKIMLSRYKCEVISALGGQEGLKKLADNSDFNLIIVDENMPHMKD